MQIIRRPLHDDDVRIRVDYSGICLSDIHNIRGDFGPRPLPRVPGHEIVGIGAEVSRFSVGDGVGVGASPTPAVTVTSVWLTRRATARTAR